MDLSTDIEIFASPSKVWHAITNIENAPNVISGIKNVNILNQPATGVIGLKWQETRSMMGKDAIETMWITNAEENHFYQTRAENCGAVYISRFDITEQPETKSVLLTMSFKGESNSFWGKIMTLLMGRLMRKSLLKMVNQDLQDIKHYCEQQP